MQTMPFFFNQCFEKKRVKKLILWSLHFQGEDKTLQMIEELKQLGFQYSTFAGVSLSIDDLAIPPKKRTELLECQMSIMRMINGRARGYKTDVEQIQMVIDTWHRTSETVKDHMIEFFEATDVLNPVYMMAFSGARGNVSQVRQLVGMRGLVSDPKGDIIGYAIRSNFREGLTMTEYLISAYGARKGVVDTALRTADAGYLTRRLVDVAQHIIVKEGSCGTNRGIRLKAIKSGQKTLLSLHDRLVGRVLAQDIEVDGQKIALRNEAIDHDLANDIIQAVTNLHPTPTDHTTSQAPQAPQASQAPQLTRSKRSTSSQSSTTSQSTSSTPNTPNTSNKILVRSPLTCAIDGGVCQLCYGWSFSQNRLIGIGDVVGILAGQSIGEPGTQLTMRTFHTGGVFTGEVQAEFRAPHGGIIHYPQAFPGLLIRSPYGQVAFLAKEAGSLIIRDGDRETEIPVPSHTALFLREGETLRSNELLGMLRELEGEGNEKVETKKMVFSAFDGEIVYEDVELKMIEFPETVKDYVRRILREDKEAEKAERARLKGREPKTKQPRLPFHIDNKNANFKRKRWPSFTTDMGNFWLFAGRQMKEPGIPLFQHSGHIVQPNTLKNRVVIDTPTEGFIRCFEKPSPFSTSATISSETASLKASSLKASSLMPKMVSIPTAYRLFQSEEEMDEKTIVHTIDETDNLSGDLAAIYQPYLHMTSVRASIDPFKNCITIGSLAGDRVVIPKYKQKPNGPFPNYLAQSSKASNFRKIIHKTIHPIQVIKDESSEDEYLEEEEFTYENFGGGKVNFNDFDDYDDEDYEHALDEDYDKAYLEDEGFEDESSEDESFQDEGFEEADLEEEGLEEEEDDDDYDKNEEVGLKEVGLEDEDFEDEDFEDESSEDEADEEDWGDKTSAMGYNPMKEKGLSSRIMDSEDEDVDSFSLEGQDMDDEDSENEDIEDIEDIPSDDPGMHLLDFKREGIDADFDLESEYPETAEPTQGQKTQNVLSNIMKSSALKKRKTGRENLDLFYYSSHFQVKESGGLLWKEDDEIHVALQQGLLFVTPYIIQRGGMQRTSRSKRRRLRWELFPDKEPKRKKPKLEAPKLEAPKRKKLKRIDSYRLWEQPRKRIPPKIGGWPKKRKDPKLEAPKLKKPKLKVTRLALNKQARTLLKTIWAGSSDRFALQGNLQGHEGWSAAARLWRLWRRWRDEDLTAGADRKEVMVPKKMEAGIVKTSIFQATADVITTNPRSKTVPVQVENSTNKDQIEDTSPADNNTIEANIVENRASKNEVAKNEVLKNATSDADEKIIDAVDNVDNQAKIAEDGDVKEEIIDGAIKEAVDKDIDKKIDDEDKEDRDVIADSRFPFFEGLTHNQDDFLEEAPGWFYLPPLDVAQLDQSEEEVFLPSFALDFLGQRVTSTPFVMTMESPEKLPSYATTVEALYAKITKGTFSETLLTEAVVSDESGPESGRTEELVKTSDLTEAPPEAPPKALTAAPTEQEIVTLKDVRLLCAIRYPGLVGLITQEPTSVKDLVVGSTLISYPQEGDSPIFDFSKDPHQGSTKADFGTRQGRLVQGTGLSIYQSLWPASKTQRRGLSLGGSCDGLTRDVSRRHLTCFGLLYQVIAEFSMDRLSTTVNQLAHTKNFELSPILEEHIIEPPLDAASLIPETNIYTAFQAPDLDLDQLINSTSTDIPVIVQELLNEPLDEPLDKLRGESLEASLEGFVDESLRERPRVLLTKSSTLWYWSKQHVSRLALKDRKSKPKLQLMVLPNQTYIPRWGFLCRFFLRYRPTLANGQKAGIWKLGWTPPWERGVRVGSSMTLSLVRPLPLATKEDDVFYPTATWLMYGDPFSRRRQYMNTEGEVFQARNGTTLIVDNRHIFTFDISGWESKMTTFVGAILRFGDEIATGVGTPITGQVIAITPTTLWLREIQPILFYKSGVLFVQDRECIGPDRPLVGLSYQRFITGDIVQGIAKVEQLFEGSQAKDQKTGIKLNTLMMNRYTRRRKEVPAEQAFTECIDILRDKLIESIQKIYLGQGVTIADIHFEIIVRRMTSWGRIRKPGHSGFFRDEIVSYYRIEKVNAGLQHKRALCIPLVVGISTAALNAESFLSAASFQETSRVLSRDVMTGKIDFLRGVKERVILGDLIPGGTGILDHIEFDQKPGKDPAAPIKRDTTFNTFLAKEWQKQVKAEEEGKRSLKQRRYCLGPKMQPIAKVPHGFHIWGEEFRETIDKRVKITQLVPVSIKKDFWYKDERGPEVDFWQRHHLGLVPIIEVWEIVTSNHPRVQEKTRRIYEKTWIYANALMIVDGKTFTFSPIHGRYLDPQGSIVPMKAIFPDERSQDDKSVWQQRDDLQRIEQKCKSQRPVIDNEVDFFANFIHAKRNKNKYKDNYNWPFTPGLPD